jgi:putative FmdB family regulatory protein
MPIYEYLCKNCGFTLDELQSIKEPPLVKCPSCGKNTLARLIGSNAGLIFKGSGFYLTDYKKTGSSVKSKHEHKESKTETNAEQKPATPHKKADKKESKKN